MPDMFFKERSAGMSGIFITFPGNCKKALTFYQACFGGILHFEMLDKAMEGYTEIPVISGALVSDRLVLYGSDLVQDGGRRVGNHMAIFLSCHDVLDRRDIIGKLTRNTAHKVTLRDGDKLVEIKDSFDVSWILGI